MKQNHCIYGFISIFLLIAFSLTTAFAEPLKKPKRIALLPIINQTSFHDTILEQTLQKQLHTAFHIPINGILQQIEWISNEEIQKVLPNYNPQDPEDMAQISKALSADYVAGFMITSAYERHFETFWDCETMLESEISLQLIGYDTAEDKMFQYKKRDFYRDADLLMGSVRFMGEKLGQTLLKKANFKQKIQQEFKNNV